MLELVLVGLGHTSTVAGGRGNLRPAGPITMRKPLTRFDAGYASFTWLGVRGGDGAGRGSRRRMSSIENSCQLITSYSINEGLSPILGTLIISNFYGII